MTITTCLNPSAHTGARAVIRRDHLEVEVLDLKLTERRHGLAHELSPDSASRGLRWQRRSVSVQNPGALSSGERETHRSSVRLGDEGDLGGDDFFSRKLDFLVHRPLVGHGGSRGRTAAEK